LSCWGGSIVSFLGAEAYPEACQVSNRKDRFPLHLLCAASSCLDSESTTDLLPSLPQSHSTGRSTRTTTTSFDVWDHPSVLGDYGIYHSRIPGSTHHKRQIAPHSICLVEKYSSVIEEDNVVLHSLVECTMRESKKRTRSPIFMRPSAIISSSCRSARRRRQINGVDLYNCYG
jgi:hypothetical protein